MGRERRKGEGGKEGVYIMFVFKVCMHMVYMYICMDVCMPFV